MISREDVVRAMQGVWLLFLDKPGAVKSFDTSVDGFWKSFQAILLVAPIYAFTVLADRRAYMADAAAARLPPMDAVAFFGSRALTVALDWVTLPVLLLLLAGPLGIRGGYSAFIVVRNWATVFTLIPYAAVSLLELAGVFSGQLVLVPSAAALAISLRVSYLTARRTLNVPIDVAIGYVVLDFLISLGLAQGLAYAFGVAG